ncbi:S-adenosyl-L-methionine-dependent methyltransferase [Rhizoctonia solani]|nr:S-adenosyl-L-methionine-dependent methyltransferase [Rhizoctonia solani]
MPNYAPAYDRDAEGMVYISQSDHEDNCDQDWDTATISTASTTQTTSTITSDEINDYFREAHGRTFAHDENLPMTYPIDDIEVHRHQMQHIFLKALVHGNHIGPVRKVLQPRSDGSRPRILDVRTCAGDWAQEMATEFPHCDIVSVDIAPITVHIPCPNISFEVYDLYAGIAEPDESFDYVSCRHVQLHVKDFDRLVFDLHRVLKPEGLITICEVENYVFEVDEPPYNNICHSTAPNVARGVEAVRGDIDCIYELETWLQPKSYFWTRTADKYSIPLAQFERASQGFCNIQKQVILLPIGTWHPDPAVQRAGEMVARTFSLAWRQTDAAMVEAGMPKEQAEEICTNAIAEMTRMDLPLLGKYIMVYATRI